MSCERNFIIRPSTALIWRILDSGRTIRFILHFNSFQVLKIFAKMDFQGIKCYIFCSQFLCMCAVVIWIKNDFCSHGKWSQLKFNFSMSMGPMRIYYSSYISSPMQIIANVFNNYSKSSSKPRFNLNHDHDFVPFKDECWLCNWCK